jgi:hypothetical protein
MAMEKKLTGNNIYFSTKVPLYATKHNELSPLLWLAGTQVPQVNTNESHQGWVWGAARVNFRKTERKLSSKAFLHRTWNTLACN